MVSGISDGMLRICRDRLSRASLNRVLVIKADIHVYTGDAWSLLDKLNMPILGLYGEADGGIPAANVKRFEADLKKKNSNVEFVLYPGTPHRFFSDDSPQSYKKDAAEDGWKRCVAFFSKHLKA